MHFDIDNDVYQQLKYQSRIEKITELEAIHIAIVEWCENRAYLRSDDGRRRFPALHKELMNGCLVKIDACQK